MANIQILPQAENIPNDAPRKFKNIDNEEFGFSWDGLPYVVKAGATEIYPKYLVNYAAMHLARKIIKRAAFNEYKTEEEKGNKLIRFVKPDQELELMREMVQDNPDAPVLKGEPEIKEKDVGVEESKETTPVGKEEGFKCEKCDFVAKSKIGLISHSRKHK